MRMPHGHDARRVPRSPKFCPLLYLLYDSMRYGRGTGTYTRFLPAYHVRAVRGVSEVWRPPALPIRNRVQDDSKRRDRIREEHERRDRVDSSIANVSVNACGKDTPAEA